MSNPKALTDLPAKTAEQMFVTWQTEKERNVALNNLAAGYEHSLVERTQANSIGNYKDVDSNINVRPTFTRQNYESFRPEEATPKSRKEQMLYADMAYHKVGLIKNVVDLMGDFGCQGINIVHSDPKVQKLAQLWFEKVKGPERSERFQNILYRLGTVPIITNYAEINNIDIKNLHSITDQNEIEINTSRPITNIPWSYTFLHPLTLEPIGGELSVLNPDGIKYGVKLPDNIKRKIVSPQTVAEKKIVSKLSPDILSAARANNGIVELGDNFSIFYYKKDDWETFPSPMLECIVDDVLMLEKLKLTDLSACDGAISRVRLWKLGDLENKILPTAAAIERLSEILSNNVGGGSFDLVWGPEIDFKESGSDLAQFLGQEKYEPALNRIYAGLGIPPSLTGSNSTTGFTNNYVSLKTLIERLEYGRRILLSFWNAQLKIFQKAFQLKEPPKVIFSRMTLSDESAEKQLLLSLLDRDIISNETVLDRFGEESTIEIARLKRENQARKDKQIPEKAGAYHNPQRIDELKKMFVQSGLLTPSEVGIELFPKKSGQKSPMEIKLANDAEKNSKGIAGQGRPNGSKDGKKRKQKTVKVRTSAEFINNLLWSKQAQAKINEIFTPIYLDFVNKSNLRELTTAEFNNLEDFKYNILCQFEPQSKITEELISTAVDCSFNETNQKVYNKLVANYVAKYQKQPTTDDARQIQLYAYSIIKGEDNG